MRKFLKGIDGFTRNIVIVFAGNSLANFFALLYQLLIAHKLSSVEFAAFNSLLAVFTLATSPLGTFQLALTKFSAEFNAHENFAKIKFLLSDFLKKSLVLSCITLVIFVLASGQILHLLKIQSQSSGYILAILVALAWTTPVFLGAVQGLELFSWLSASSVITGLFKLLSAFIFISLGYKISGALGALLAANLVTIVILYLPLRKFFSFRARKQDINYQKIFVYLIPVAVGYSCWIALVSFDMVLVKYFFSPEDSGVYALAQMLGKIFLFFPSAISLVMFPRTSGMSSKKLETIAVLKKSLFYISVLSFCAIVFYNLSPALVLTILTGKANPESIYLGRLFSISMSFFASLFILISYFLSLNDFRFIKYLLVSTILQYLIIFLFHANLAQVQLIICVNAILVFIVHLLLALKRK